MAIKEMMKIRFVLALATGMLCSLALQAQAVHYKGTRLTNNTAVSATAPGTLTSDPDAKILTYSQSKKPQVVIPYSSITDAEYASTQKQLTVHYKKSDGIATSAEFALPAATGDQAVKTIQSQTGIQVKNLSVPTAVGTAPAAAAHGVNQSH